MSDVFVVGALHLDVVVDAPRLPQLDETLMGSAVAYRFGGKGGNQALAAARMGALVSMAGRVGDDSFAEPVLQAFDRACVDRTQVRAVEGPTGMSVAIVQDGGDYAAVVVSGVNATIDPNEIDPGSAALLLLQNEIPEAVNIAVARRVSNARIVLNAAPAREVSQELLSATDVLVVNRVEAAQITNKDPANLDAPAVARELAALGPGSVVVTLGEAGAVLWDGESLETIVPPLRAQGSSHGAGDAFVGALAAELAQGKVLSRAARFATNAAAHFVTTPSEAREAIQRVDVEAWMAGVGR